MFTAERAASTECAVAPMAHEMIRLLAQRRLYDGRSDDLLALVDDRIEELERAVGLARAGSALGVFFQVCVAHASVDALESWTSEKDGREEVERAEQCLVGLAAVHFTEEARPLADYYMLRRFRVLVV